MSHTASPAMIWSARNSMQTTANRPASAVAATTPTRKPSHREPVTSAPNTAENAAMMSSPSRPMLMTPDFSAKIPPIAAKTIGTDSRSVAASVDDETTSPKRRPGPEAGATSAATPSHARSRAATSATSARPEVGTPSKRSVIGLTSDGGGARVVLPGGETPPDEPEELRHRHEEDDEP